MTVRRILTVDSDLAVLKQKSAPVAAVDDDLRRLMDDMLATMYAAPGIGLAAIQIGVAKRVIVMDLAKKVERPLKVRLRYLNYQGDQVEEEAEELYAVCIQHEMDHLNGVLFIDHLSRLKRQRAVAKVKKTARADA